MAEAKKTGRPPVHGLTKSPEFSVWHGMRSRCNNPNATSYEIYGGRGIRVCDAWQNSFVTFLRDMGKRPSKVHQLDRIDNDADYSKENCRWATARVNQRNKSTVKKLTLDGLTLPLPTWAEKLKMTTAGLNKRLEKGWSVNDTLKTPKNRKPPQREAAKGGRR